uniref:putative receptor-like protein kinase At3g47110 n=1 Tax=Erigeron canadensis TaxID=72917 RepID=UPI001CB8B4EF|nr:putative receptor-like protein kinase At3g47110 [Erigeron canadensis]
MSPLICLSSYYSPRISFLFYAIFVTLTTASAGGNASDHAALLSFKEMIIHDPYGALSTWNNSIHFCNWHGVSCGKRHRRVIVLRLDSTALEGSLSPHIGNLSFLRHLNLGNNSFQGSIPHELGRISRLRVLDLEENKFSGSIPTNLSGCFNLEALGLAKNMLVGNIPNEISFLSKLTIVTIHKNKLTGGIPPSLGNITSMEAFSAYGNPFGGTIPETLGNWKNLTQIGFAECNLHGTIPYFLYNLSLLTALSFPTNNLTGSLPPTIDLPNLEWLELNNNKLSGLLPPSLSNCSKLNILEISYNSFIGKLTIDFAKLRDLRFLFLIGNDFGRGGDVKFLIDSLKNCSSLIRLGLTECNFQGMVPQSIGNLSQQLVRLRLGGNRFYGAIPSSIGNLVGLKYLSLDANQFSGSIPSTIGMLQNLGFVALDENHFSGPIPEVIGNLSSLITLRLGSNRLEGHIPTSLGNCQKLSELHLHDNKLSGTIPKQLFQLPSLSITFNLSNNNLSGSLPNEIGDLKMLTALDISYNNISGDIPVGLAGCTSLTFLSLKGNLLQGMISSSLRSLRGLEVLDISHNNLSGRIPQFLESLPLKFMNLSFNDFEGDVPVVGVFSNASAFSILGNSRLCGGLVELRLPRCKKTKKQERRFYWIIIVIVVTLLLFGVVCLVYACRKKKKNREFPQTSKNEGFLKVWVPKWYGRTGGYFHANFFTMKVTYNQLHKATNGFSEANLIGKGGFSSVYKGILEHDDKFIAVKVLHLLIRGAHKSFIAECEAWRNIRHRNLLKIITLCSSVDFQGNDFKALVYEFMPNGSLNDWLHSSASKSKLSLIQRVNILIDIASALDYLHNECLTRIAHGDLKPSNILLDNDMVAHIGDFGLARFLGTSSNKHSSTGVKGTIGYAPPEYGLGNEITSSGDVYSFGILLLEVMTGKKPTDDIFDEGLSLHKFVSATFPDHVIDVIDESAIVMQNTKANAQKVDECLASIFKTGELDECLASILKIGVSCSVETPSCRMNIKIVVEELMRILDILLKAFQVHHQPSVAN